MLPAFVLIVSAYIPGTRIKAANAILKSKGYPQITGSPDWAI